MSRQADSCLRVNVKPTNNIIPVHRLIGWDHELLGADGNVFAASMEQIDPGVAGLGAVGLTVVVEAGAAIDGVENRLKSNADGQVIPVATPGTDVVAAMLKPGQSATAEGDPVEVYLIQSVSAS